jgi:hypothetical protein
MSIAKWSGAWLGAVAWFADQQIVATTAYANCPAYSRELALGVGIGCALLAVAGGWHSWRARQALPAEGERFIATISVLLAAISILAILFGTTAGVVLRCER